MDDFDTEIQCEEIFLPEDDPSLWDHSVQDDDAEVLK